MPVKIELSVSKPPFSNATVEAMIVALHNLAHTFQLISKKIDHGLSESCDTFHEQQHSQEPQLAP